LAQRRRGAADPPLAVCGGFLRAGPDIGDACELDKQRIEPRALMRQQIGIALEDFHATTPVRRLPRMIAMPVRRTDHPLQMHDLLVGAMRREAKRRCECVISFFILVMALPLRISRSGHALILSLRFAFRRGLATEYNRIIRLSL
jgi:hypothetical protein